MQKFLGANQPGAEKLLIIPEKGGQAGAVAPAAGGLKSRVERGEPAGGLLPGVQPPDLPEEGPLDALEEQPIPLPVQALDCTVADGCPMLAGAQDLAVNLQLPP